VRTPLPTIASESSIARAAFTKSEVIEVFEELVTAQTLLRCT